MVCLYALLLRLHHLRHRPLIAGNAVTARGAVKEGWRPTALVLLLVLDDVQLSSRPGQAHLVERLVLVDGRPGDHRTLERVNVVLEIQHVGTAALDGAQLNIQLLVAGQKQISTVLINLIILHHVGDETHLALQLNDVGDSGHFLRKRGIA